MEEGLEFKIGELLRQRRWKLAVAESCTGGLIGHRITNVPGSSDYYWGSITAYSYEAKERLLGVSRSTLEKFGAVSEETVLAMARGARQALEAEIGLAVTGIAGPGGGLPNKPVGLVWIGLSAPSEDQAWRYIWEGSRVENKAYSAQAALQILFDYLKGKSMERVEVQARWDSQGKVIPLEFTWQGQIYPVASTGRRWKDEAGEHILCLTPDQRTFELIFHPLERTWSMGFHAGRPSAA